MKVDTLAPLNEVLIKIPSPHHILILYNPISSAGNTEETAKRMETELAYHRKNVAVHRSEKKTKAYKRIKIQLPPATLSSLSEEMEPSESCWVL